MLQEALLLQGRERGGFSVAQGNMNSVPSLEILEAGDRSSVRELKLKQSWVMHSDSDPKHKSTFPSECLKSNKTRAFAEPQVKVQTWTKVQVLW